MTRRQKMTGQHVGPAKPAPKRHDWRPVTEALFVGQTLFLPQSQLNGQGVKYLQLVVTRSGDPTKVLHVESVERDGVKGRDIWIAEPSERVEIVPEPVFRYKAKPKKKIELTRRHTISPR